MLASKRSEGTFMDHWGDDFGDGTCSSESGGKTIHICAPTSLRYLPMWVQVVPAILWLAHFIWIDQINEEHTTQQFFCTPLIDSNCIHSLRDVTQVKPERSS